jgi:4-aminobutyrate aminotransferase
VDHAASLGRRTIDRLNELKRHQKLIGEVRGVGLLIGVELLRPDGTRACAEAEAVMYECLSRGLNFKVTMGNILTLTPALVITESQMDRAIEILDASLSSVSGPAR